MAISWVTWWFFQVSFTIIITLSHSANEEDNSVPQRILAYYEVAPTVKYIFSPLSNQFHLQLPKLAFCNTIRLFHFFPKKYEEFTRILSSSPTKFFSNFSGQPLKSFFNASIQITIIISFSPSQTSCYQQRVDFQGFSSKAHIRLDALPVQEIFLSTFDSFVSQRLRPST